MKNFQVIRSFTYNEQRFGIGDVVTVEDADATAADILHLVARHFIVPEPEQPKETATVKPDEARETREAP